MRIFVSAHIFCFLLLLLRPLPTQFRLPAISIFNSSLPSPESYIHPVRYIHFYANPKSTYFAVPGFLLLLSAPAFIGIHAATDFHTAFLASAASHSVAGVSADAELPVAGILMSLMSLIVLGKLDC
jgi:hypothetical protein